jgi:eukaryotic-like serine/threonine-protein kinase
MSTDGKGVSKAPPSLDPMIGQTINDRFRITGLLARGGMGKVYRAEQAPLGRICAVKVLTPRSSNEQDADFQRRFFNEASICARLTHPNTVTIFDYGRTDENVYWMAMEYLEGRTLSRALREEGPFDAARATHIARQICRSLREAHTLGVIHRDLKPANIYLVEHGDEHDMVKVLDFGLVKNIEADADEDVTQAGIFMGSPKYMAPEQIRGEHVDARTDVYALGVILYEMVSGKVPFDRANQVDILLAHTAQAVPPLAVDVDPGVAAIIMRCLEKAPEARYVSMDEVLLALKQVAPAGQNTRSLQMSGSFEGLSASASLTPQSNVLPSVPSPSTESLTPGPTPRANRSSAKLWIGAFAAAAVIVAVLVPLTTRHRSDTPTSAATGGNPSVTETAHDPGKASTDGPAATVATIAPEAKTPELAPEVKVESDPPGARVLDEQKVVLCDTTPCKVRVDPKGMVVTLALDGYGNERVKLTAGEEARHVKLAKKATVVVANPGTKKEPPPPPGTAHSGFLGNPY